MAEVLKSHYLDTPLEEQMWASLMFVAHKTAVDGFRISGLKGKWKKVRWLDYSGKKLDEAALEALLLILFSAILLECRGLRYALAQGIIKLPEKRKKGKRKPIPPGLHAIIDELTPYLRKFPEWEEKSLRELADYRCDIAHGDLKDLGELISKGGLRQKAILLHTAAMKAMAAMHLAKGYRRSRVKALQMLVSP